MNIYNTFEISEISQDLLNGNVVCMPTDTIYGLHCIFGHQSAIEKIYKIKQRPLNLPLITIISKDYDITQFGIYPDFEQKIILGNYWPGNNTIIFELEDGGTVSLRKPDNNFLDKILSVTGPLISTSANMHGSPNIKTINEAASLFGEQVDSYVDGGRLEGKPSNIYKLHGSELIKQR